MTGPGAGHEMDPDTVRSGAAKYGPLADDLTDAGKKLESALEAIGACWGDDEGGKAFAKDYEPAAENCVDAFGDLAKALRGVAKNVKAAADAVDGTHEDAADAIKKTGQV